MVTNRFFEPYKGEKYEEGINGKKILVVGASFYCDKLDCPFFSKCTSTIIKDSSAYNNLCPKYKDKDMLLCKEPSYCIEDEPKTYKRFTDAMADFVGCAKSDEIWKYLAFTNYVQFFLPSRKKGKARFTRKSDLSERDFLAFNETLMQLQPDIVIIWGCVFNSQVKEKNPDLINNGLLADTNNYVCQIKPKGFDKPITIINPYHPSYRQWFCGVEIFKSYFSGVINN
ncbi:MAG: hypothetical protein HUJ63_10155 [Enterococcus sp.]|nr:hypothetical protein [Enterococcus sp.]